MFQSKQIKTKLVVTSRGIKLAVNHTINNNGSKKKKAKELRKVKMILCLKKKKGLKKASFPEQTGLNSGLSLSWKAGVFLFSKKRKKMFTQNNTKRPCGSSKSGLFIDSHR